MYFLNCNICCGDKVSDVPIELPVQEKCVLAAPTPTSHISNDDMNKIKNFFKHFDTDENGLINEEGI